MSFISVIGSLCDLSQKIAEFATREKCGEDEQLKALKEKLAKTSTRVMSAVVPDFWRDTNINFKTGAGGLYQATRGESKIWFVKPDDNDLSNYRLLYEPEAKGKANVDFDSIVLEANFGKPQEQTRREINDGDLWLESIIGDEAYGMHKEYPALYSEKVKLSEVLREASDENSKHQDKARRILSFVEKVQNKDLK